MPVPINNFVVDTIVRWPQRRVEPDSPPRLDVRLVLGSSEIVEQVQAQLARSELGWFIVRSSGHPKAVKLRHGVPSPADAIRPSGLRPNAPLVYLLFWQPGEPGHDDHAQSLADL